MPAGGIVCPLYPREGGRVRVLVGPGASPRALAVPAAAAAAAAAASRRSRGGETVLWLQSDKRVFMNDPFFSLAFGWLYRVSAFPQDTACGGVVESVANVFVMMIIQVFFEQVKP